MEEFESIAMADIYPFYKKFVNLVNSDSGASVPTDGFDVSFFDDMLSYKYYVTIHIPGLADLFKLFGIGDVSGNDLKLKGYDAVFFHNAPSRNSTPDGISRPLSTSKTSSARWSPSTSGSA